MFWGQLFKASLVSLSICQLNYQIHCYSLLEKCEKDSHIFSTKNNSVFVIFNETLNNDVVNFEQPAPDCVSSWSLLTCYF